MSDHELQVHVLYPNSVRAEFNMDYYLSTHLPLCEKYWLPMGLKSWTITELSEETGYCVQATMIWESAEKWEKASNPMAQELIDDVKYYSTGMPVRWLGKVVGKRDA